jgi:hypothetical protein
MTTEVSLSLCPPRYCAALRFRFPSMPFSAYRPRLLADRMLVPSLTNALLTVFPFYSAKGTGCTSSWGPYGLPDLHADPPNSKTFLARLCEQAERYDEMVTYMKEVAKVRDTGT